MLNGDANSRSNNGEHLSTGTPTKIRDFRCCQMLLLHSPRTEASYVSASNGSPVASQRQRSWPNSTSSSRRVFIRVSKSEADFKYDSLDGRGEKQVSKTAAAAATTSSMSPPTTALTLLSSGDASAEFQFDDCGRNAKIQLECQKTATTDISSYLVSEFTSFCEEKIPPLGVNGEAQIVC